MESHSALTIALPPWLASLNQEPRTIAGPLARMDFVIGLAERNLREQTGGPFAAAIFETETGRLVAAAANIVVWARCSVLHAEILAILLAQARLGTYDLHADGVERELVCSAEPCAMCFGAIPWSGLRKVVSGARDEDARAIGFDEGAKVPSWSKALNERGIAVVENVRREQAVEVLKRYSASGGEIYNPD